MKLLIKILFLNKMNKDFQIIFKHMFNIILISQGHLPIKFHQDMPQNLSFLEYKEKPFQKAKVYQMIYQIVINLF